MQRSALFFVPTNPYPPQNGAHWRHLSMLGALKQLGMHVTLVGTTLMTDAAWTAASVERLRGRWVDDVRIYEPTAADLLHVARIQRRYATARDGKQAEHDSHAIFASTLELYRAPAMRDWFGRLYDDRHPDLLFMSYAFYDGLVDHLRAREAIRIMDSVDLWSLNLGLQYAVARYFRGDALDPWSISDEAVRDDFARTLGVTASAEEFQVFDRYHYTIAIADHEAVIMRERTARTQVVHIPMTFDPFNYHENQYSGDALFLTAPHIFNTQAIVYFIRKVVPLVRNQAPEFSLRVTGNVDERLHPWAGNGLTFTGFVPDLTPTFAQARFLVCPLLSGTGQKVKIVEAMAHGLPVVATAYAAQGSPIRHGHNGLVAASAEEFAAHVVRLWRDPDLCRQLGQAARSTIARQFSTNRLVEQLRPLVR